MQITVKTGDILTHPIHGEMKGTNVNPTEYEEFVQETQAFEKGYRVEAIFDRFIPGIKWVEKDANGERISKLIFHSWYLQNLERG